MPRAGRSEKVTDITGSNNTDRDKSIQNDGRGTVCIGEGRTLRVVGLAGKPAEPMTREPMSRIRAFEVLAFGTDHPDFEQARKFLGGWPVKHQNRAALGEHLSPETLAPLHDCLTPETLAELRDHFVTEARAVARQCQARELGPRLVHEAAEPAAWIVGACLLLAGLGVLGLLMWVWSS